MSSPDALSTTLRQAQHRALLVGAAGSLLAVAAWWLLPRQFFRSYLLAYLFWIGIALGGSAMAMLSYLIGGRWSILLRRILESSARTIPLMALLFLPVLFGVPDLYPWAGAHGADHTPMHYRAEYLNRTAFLIRSAIYFSVWIGVLWLLRRRAQPPPEPRDAGLYAARLRSISGPGLLLYLFTATFASIDWAMSLEPAWHSSAYGALFIAGQIAGSFAFAVAAALALLPQTALKNVLTPSRLHDLGTLLLVFIMLWAYVAFSQYLIIWSGNLPREVPWYIRRIQGGWGWLAIGVMAAHFLLPLALLLSREVKRDARWLAAIAWWVLAMRFVDLYWTVAPAFGSATPTPHWLDLAMPVAMGGLWLGVFAQQLAARPLISAQDADRLEGSCRA